MSAPAPHEPSAWLRSVLTKGPTSTCPHISSDETLRELPTILLVSAGRLTCLECPIPVVEPGSKRDRTCDRCGRICPDQPGQRIFAGVLHIGKLTVRFNACPDCGRKEGLPMYRSGDPGPN